MRSSYKTVQKEKIIEVIKNYNHDFTINDIYNSLDNQVGLTTIYRMINKLIDEGMVSKLVNDNKDTYYQYLGKCEHNNHFYLKCDKCGNLEHVDCDCIIDLYNHINQKHQFMINKNKIIINGLCNKCSRRGE